MVSLTGLICGILMLLTGMGYWSIITGAVFGVLADLVLKSGDYKSAKKRNHIAWCFFYVDHRKLHPHCCNTGQLLSAANQRLWTRVCRFHYELYLAYTLPLLLIAGFVCGVIGGVIGQKIFKKHFKRAGIA